VDYPINCECSKVHRVQASDAGRTISCTCGRAFEVPPLNKLRAAAGEEALSPDLRIEILLGQGELPRAVDCCRCGVKTDRRSTIHVTCERQEVRQPPQYLFTRIARAFFLGLLWFRSGGAPQTFGRDVAFHLPLRLCAGCAATMTNTGARKAMQNEPDYARLLEKYPRTIVAFIRE